MIYIMLACLGVSIVATMAGLIYSFKTRKDLGRFIRTVILNGKKHSARR